MKVSREQMAENRQKILHEAGKLFREKGFDAVSVAEIMQAAGLTHGGFYGHFKSKDDLIDQALVHAMTAPDQTLPPLASFVETYLSAQHRDERGQGCVIAGLSSEVLRQGPEARRAMAEGVQAQITRMEAQSAASGEAARRREAVASISALVGALILSRVTDGTPLSDEILSETRAWITGALA